MGRAKFVIASVSEAIHGAAAESELDCFVASAPRNDEWNARHGFAISQHVLLEFCTFVPPFPIRGRRECRAPDPPAAACAVGWWVERTRVSQVTPESSGIPRAMVYGLWRARLGGRFFHRRRLIAPPTWRLLRVVRITRFCRPPQAPSSRAPSTATATRSALMTFAQRPSGRNGMASDID
jgi:hypothetical protein